MLLLMIISTVALSVTLWHVVALLHLWFRPNEKSFNFFQEGLPFYWIGWTLYAVRHAVMSGQSLVEDTQMGSLYYMFLVVLDVYLALKWYKLWKSSDDDRWKKRRKKVADKIKSMSGRLVVIPASS